MRRKLRFIAGVALMVAAIAYLIIAAVRNTAEYYLTVNEVAARKAELAGQNLRVAGRVAAGSITWNAATLTLAFAMTQPSTAPAAGIKPVAATETDSIGGASASFRVIARGQPKPDMFAPVRDVIVEGRLDTDGTIEARQVLTSCPSKYVPKQQ
jgi:cytochrome c-type biogenesis protein CcmE